MSPCLPASLNACPPCLQATAYARLSELGATPVSEVLTAGGGAANDVWTAIRQRVIGVPVRQSGNTDAAFGAALLAREGYRAAKGAEEH